MMRLKEAFRYQNALKGLIRGIQKKIGENEYNVNNYIMMTEKVHHLRSQGNKDAADEVIENPQRDENTPAANTLINLFYDLNAEKIALTAAIGQAKKEYPKLDYDAAIEQNIVRGNMIDTLSLVNALKGYKRLDTDTGYMINQEGNQVQYRYPTETEASIDFDRRRVKAMLAKLTSERDSVSDDIEEAKLMIEVNFVPKYDINATIDDIIADATPA